MRTASLGVTMLGVDNVVYRLRSQREGGGMFARVSTFDGRPEQVDVLVHTALEMVLAQLKRYEGFNGALALANRGSGKV